MANYENLTKAAVAFMQENLAKPISVPDVAKAVRYSKVHLELAFRKVTGAGVRENLIQMRMSRAKAFLMETNLPVSEIAFRTGYRDSTYFAAAFRLREGTTPTEFREAAQTAKGLTASARQADADGRLEPLFQDSFTGPDLGPWWHPTHDQWQMAQGYVEGRDAESNSLLLEKALPENFRIQVECSVLGGKEIMPSDLVLLLTDATGTAHCYEFHIGANENSLGILRRAKATVLWNPKAVIRSGHWHKIEIEFKQDNLVFRWDGQELFAHRDPFPPPYGQRCRFCVGTWRNAIRLRWVAVEDLGFVPMVSAIRQADLLFGEGLYERAREFYLRYFQSSREASEIAELSYKVGMCCLRQKYLTQAREWFEKVSAFAQGSFWDTCAKFALLETSWEAGDIQSFKERFTIMSQNPNLQNGIRRIAHNCHETADAGGFHEAAAFAAETLVHMEEPESFLKALAQQFLANSLIQFNKPEEAEHHLRAALVCQNASKTMRIFLRFTLSDVYAALGRFNESENMLKEIEAAEPSPFNLLRGRMQRGRNLCAEGNDEEGLALLQGDANASASPEMAAFAHLTASLVYCSRKDAQKARTAIGRARTACPGSYYLQKGTISRFLYPILLLEGEILKAAEALKEDAYVGDTPPAIRAEQATKAGILFELADKEREAREIWVHTSQRFTETQCPFWGGLAKRLIAGENDLLEQMPFPRANRVEMFYLAGLRSKRRKEEARAKQLFALAIKEDYMRLWPSCWAKGGFQIQITTA